jgi:predicted glycosyltransferase involved in capsule biosynthesis
MSLKEYTIIYAYRNRETKRIQQSLLSLQAQNSQNFQVLFVDYGSNSSFSAAIKNCVERFPFVTYHYIGHPGLLWNKSKALNYGIALAQTPFVVLADVDVVFSPHFTQALNPLKSDWHFSLFKIGYLSHAVTAKVPSTPYSQWTPKFIGDTFGIGLFPKSALLDVCGLDPFFHFYGSEDADLNLRLQHAGYAQKRCEDDLLRHQWHPRYPKSKDKMLTVQPRLFNALRLNQQQLFWHERFKTTKHADSEVWQQVILPKAKKDLEVPNVTVELTNIQAEVVHFVKVQLPSYRGKVVRVVFKEAEIYRSLKYRVKQALGRLSQPYWTLKQINDMVLEEIVLNYRHHNYAYTVTEDLKEIHFTINLI